MENKTLYIATCHTCDEREDYSSKSIGIYTNIDTAKMACVAHNEQNINDYFMFNKLYVDNPKWEEDGSNLYIVFVEDDNIADYFITYEIEPSILNAMPKKEGI